MAFAMPHLRAPGPPPCLLIQRRAIRFYRGADIACEFRDGGLGPRLNQRPALDALAECKVGRKELERVADLREGAERERLERVGVVAGGREAVEYNFNYNFEVIRGYF